MINNPNTVDLLQRIKAGDTKAREELYERYYARILAVVRMRLGAKLRSKLESVDVVQDAFFRSLNALENFQYRSDGAFMHFMAQIVERTIRDQADYFSAQKRDVGKETPLAEVHPSHDTLWGPIADLATQDTPSIIVSKIESVVRLEQAIDLLSADQREALILVRYEEMSYDEAGKVMDRSPDAVRMLVARSIVQLGKMLSSC